MSHTIYLLRHGQSNQAQGTFQSDLAELSVQGNTQIRQIASQFNNFNIEEIWTSPILRALQTAELILQHMKTPIPFIREPLAEEWRKPSLLFGRKFNDPVSIKIIKLLQENRNNPSFTYSDDECFQDIISRAESLINNLYNSKKAILLVTHGHLMRVIYLLMTKQKSWTQDDYWSWESNILIPNAALMKIKFIDSKSSSHISFLGS